VAYLVHARVPQPHEVWDFMANAKKVDLQMAWRGEIDVAEFVTYNAKVWRIPSLGGSRRRCVLQIRRSDDWPDLHDETIDA
jgi:hypothetical protein